MNSEELKEKANKFLNTVCVSDVVYTNEQGEFVSIDHTMLKVFLTQFAQSVLDEQAKDKTNEIKDALENFDDDRIMEISANAFSISQAQDHPMPEHHGHDLSNAVSRCMTGMRDRIKKELLKQ